MSIYTYNQSKAICGCLGISFEENPCLSDQELNKIPIDAIVNRNPPIQHMFGDDNPMRRREVSQKVSKSLTGKCLSDFHKDKISKSKIGKRVTNYPKNRNRNWIWVTDGISNIRVNKDEEIPEQFRRGTTKFWKTGFSNGKKETVQCPFCDKIGGKPSMMLWHFDKCKYAH